MGKIIPKEPELRHEKVVHQKQPKNVTNNTANMVATNNSYGYFYTPPVVTPNPNNPVPAFGFADYVFEADGTVKLRTSSIEDTSKQTVPVVGTNGLANIILNDPTIKTLVPDLNVNDIFFYNNMLFMKIRRGPGNEENYRLDILENNVIYIQAPLEFPLADVYANNSIFKFVSVPVGSETGQKILTVEKYVIKSMDSFEINKAIFRITNDAA